MEITIVSAQGLKNKSPTLFSSRLRPFITLTITTAATTSGDKRCHVYKTRVDDHGGANPTWGDKFHIPTTTDKTNNNSVANNTYACMMIYLELYTKRRLTSAQSLLGCCQIPVNDIGFPTVGCVRNLSYRLRARDGSRGHGVVNLAIKLEPPPPPPLPAVVVPAVGALDTCPVIGIPVICQNQLGVKL